ncbi:MAG: 23S rRNA (adenine(2503)-C(2))-methyltransferase RlmN [Candidatus Omnitrophica bacterium]|nr:23S rRNA (adenine(2503)-C(2))-methyltransferase RlmN [Candidatus Omnitrophota bacterium]
MENIYEFALPELTQRLAAHGFPAYRAVQVFGWLYKKRAEEFAKMRTLPPHLRRELADTFYCGLPECTLKRVSADKTEKYLFRLTDGRTVETVMIPEKKRRTLCVSSQVGCRFNCAFCASGASGFQRNLTVAEIVGQHLWAADHERPVTHIVYMGIGEPLDNFANVAGSISLLCEPKGLGFSPRKITVSTCGIIPRLPQLAEAFPKVKLSVSLHAATDDLRSRLMPVNRKYPLKNLMPALKTYTKTTGQPVTCEYALIGGLNTGIKQARSLAKLLGGIKHKVNLIPLHAARGNARPATEEETTAFTAELKKKNIFFTLRASRGPDIDAACGQLRAQARGGVRA